MPRRNGGEATVYAQIVEAVAKTLRAHASTEPEVVAYMVARAALLEVRARRGAGKAAELAYKLADEFAGEWAA